MAKQLKKYVRYDGNRQLVPGSMIERYTQPKGKFEEVIIPDPDGCCISTDSYEYVNRDGYRFNGSTREHRWPTYYLSDSYAPPTEMGRLVLPIHSAQIGSTYMGRSGTTISQPQGAVQIYFPSKDANGIEWGNGSDWFNFLTGWSTVVTFEQNGVSVSYQTTASYPTFAFSASSLGTFGYYMIYHDEVFGIGTPALNLVLINESQNNVAFNTVDPIIIKVKYPF